MAIDDNTSYELTGYQVKDLATKVRGKADSSSLASVATSGLYSDLIGTPTIPTVNNATLTVTQNGTSAGTFTANASSDVTIALTDTTYSAMTGASSGTAGTSGLVPAPAAGDESKVLSGAGTWVNQPTVPTVNDGTLTIQHNGTTKGTFTANQGTASTVNIETIYADTPGTATTPAASVQASDIDTTTLPGANGTAVLTGSMSGTSWADVSNCSFTTTQAGLYWIGYEISSAFVGVHEFSIEGRINIGGTNYAACSQFSIKNWAGNYGASNSNSLVQWIPANTMVKMQARMNNYSGDVNCTMNYIQIY